VGKFKKAWIGERRVFLPVLKGRELVVHAGHLQQQQCSNLQLLSRLAKALKFLSSKFLIAQKIVKDAKAFICLMPLNLLRLHF
jgi:hypothetical protein